MGQLFSIGSAAIRLFGFFQSLEYDAVIVGAGGGGIPLAQTLVEGGKRVLLLERGGERPSSSDNIRGFGDVLRSSCIEDFDSEGIVVSTGNCLGGATAVNQGIFILPNIEWISENLGMLDMNAITSAFDWIKARVSPSPTEQPVGSNAAIFQAGLRASYENSGFSLGNIDPGQDQLIIGQAFGAHSIFENDTGRRRSAEDVLDRSHDLLTLRLRTQVSRLIFDGDWFAVPFTARFSTGDTPRARCVLLTNFDRICVKREGRIYLSAGAFHTPELLMKSGIGPNGRRVENDDVGMHLQDKPVDLVAYFLQPDFDYSDVVTLSNTAATTTFTTDEGETSVGLFEELTIGVPGALLQGVQYERVSLARPFRFSLANTLLTRSIDWCLEETGIIPAVLNLINLCDTLNSFVDTGCTTRSATIASLISQPTSEGSVTVGLFGKLNINVNFLDTAVDRKGFSLASKKSAEVLEGIVGEAAVEGDGEGTCRSLRRSLLDLEVLGLPLSGAADFIGVPLDEGRGEVVEDDLENGNRLANVAIAAHHYAGTAQLGKVVDEQFRVVGVSGLYVADASLMPRTPPVNSMATTMMLGRLAGNLAVATMN